MAIFVLLSVLFSALVGHSSGAYCVCKDGVGEAQMQKNIDYACGNGADCSAIVQNGACYNPNTVKDHCNYAVNSYYQKRVSSGANCDFSGTATLTANLPSQQSGSCTYPSSAGSAGGSTSPSGNPSTSPTTPGIGTGTGTGTGTTPGTGTGTSTGTGIGTGTGTGTGTTPGFNSPTPTFGLAPSGTGMTGPDGSAAASLHQGTMFVTLTLLFLSLVCPPRV